MGLTAEKRILLLGDSNSRPPIKGLVLPKYSKALLARLPELEQHHIAMQKAVDDFVKSLNVTLAPTTAPV